jgi:threonine/homoserine/homoserine lactone efflux protein
MPNAPTLVVFAGAAIALLLTPGPAVLYIVTRSIEQGRIAGLMSVLGICAGTLFHVAAAALGISALLVSSALAFSVLKYVGAAYLVFLGIRTLLTKPPARAEGALNHSSLQQVFTQGVVVNLLNPHTALFFFAFLPQFVDPAKGHVSAQIVALGLLFIAMAATTDAGWAIAAGTAGNWIKGHPRFARAQRSVAGCALIGLGAATAVSGSGRK